MKPRITIITPSYNQGQFLEETILSVISQKYKSLEYIIIDGGSKDNSPDLIKTYSKHLSFWVSEKDAGQSEAINKGLKMATGDIITWLNSDDVYNPKTLEQVAELYTKSPDTLIFHGKSILFGENERDKILGKYDKAFNQKYLSYIPFPQPSMFINKKLFERTGPLNASLHYGMDFDLLARAYLIGDVQFANSLWSKYRLHTTSKTNDILRFAEEWAIVFSKVLRSFHLTQTIIDQYRELNFYVEGSDQYLVEKKFSYSDLERAFCYHLLMQLNFHYLALDLERTKQIIRFLKKHYPAFCKIHGLDKLMFKATYLNRNLISLMRSLKNR